MHIGSCSAASTVVSSYVGWPEWLLEPGPRGLLVWQWMSIPLLIASAGAGGAALGRLTRAVLGYLARSVMATWSDAVMARMRTPLAVAWAIVLLLVIVPWLELRADVTGWVVRVLREGLLIVFFWSIARGVEVGARMIIATPWAAARPSSRSLVSLAGRVLKVIIVAMAMIAFASELGYPVGSLIAGLGIGGLAFALAAQKTVENLFGAFSIGADQPFREGDFVKVEDLTGTVESIGLRSTRIRTLDRTLVTIPNAKLADARLESFSARDRMRLSCTIGLVYGTSASQMRLVLDEFERVLCQHPKIWPDRVVVLFKEFGPSSLDIEIMAWFQTADWAEFQVIRQEVLMSFMEAVERSGSSFAFPTSTVHVVMPPTSSPS